MTKYRVDNGRIPIKVMFLGRFGRGESQDAKQFEKTSQVEETEGHEKYLAEDSKMKKIEIWKTMNAAYNFVYSTKDRNRGHGDDGRRT